MCCLGRVPPQQPGAVCEGQAFYGLIPAVNLLQPIPDRVAQLILAKLVRVN